MLVSIVLFGILSSSFSVLALEDETSDIVETELYSGLTTIDEPWTVVTSTNTTNSNGTFDSEVITKGGYFHVEYTGEEGNVSLAISNWTTAIWAGVSPSNSGETETGFYSYFTFEDCAKAYGTEDFSDLSTICTQTTDTSSPMTITKISWYNRSNN